MKLRYVLMMAGVSLCLLFRREIIKLYGFISIYHTMCIPYEVHPGTCPSLATLARLQYSAYEAALIGVANQLTDLKRWYDWAPILFLFLVSAFALRRFRRKNNAGEFGIDLEEDVFAFMD